MHDASPELPQTLIPEGRYRVGRGLPEATLEFLRQQAAKVGAAGGAVRPWHYWELHNPWSRAGTVYESWGFLELCHAPALLDPVTELIGPDIVLFDSGWLPNPSLTRGAGTDTPDPELSSDAARFPVEPLGGATVLVAFAAETHAGLSLDLGSIRLPFGSGVVCALEARVAYRVCGIAEAGLPSVYVARYFPATARYLRDPALAVHRDLTERYPLLNYARLPLWLVRGEDRAENDFVTGFSVRAAYWGTAAGP
jgi:hypothetical protein